MSWLTENESAIKQRLAWVSEQSAGVIFQKITPAQTVIVDKVSNKIRLVLPCPVTDMIQSVLNLSEPLYLTAPYNQAFMLGLVWHPAPPRIYMGGVGGGCFQLVLHHHLPQTHLDCVEIDAVVLEVAQKFFGLALDSHLIATVQDARAYLHAADSPLPYQLIFMDAFMGYGESPYHLVTQEFYQLCRRRLTPDGVILINMPHDVPFYASKVRTLQTVFEHVYINRVEMGNSVVIGTNSAVVSYEELIERARILQNQHRFAFSLLKRAKMIKLPSQLDEVVPYLEQSPILTDAVPPTDYPRCRTNC